MNNDLWKVMALPLLLAMHYALLCYICWRAWHAFACAAPGRHFNFHITDIWAAMIGLTPSLLLAAHVSHSAAPEWQLFALLMLAPAQLAWMFKGRLLAQEAELKAGSGHCAMESAMIIVGSALVAVPFVLLSVLALTVFLPGAILYAVLYVRREAREELAR